MTIYVKEMYKEANEGLIKIAVRLLVKEAGESLDSELYHSIRDAIEANIADRGGNPKEAATRIVDSIVELEGYMVLCYEDNAPVAVTFFYIDETVHWGTVPIELVVGCIGGKVATRYFAQGRAALIEALGNRYIKTRYKDGAYITQEINKCHL